RDPSRLQVFVRVLNFRKDEAEVTVELEWRIGEQPPSIRDQTRTLRGRALRPGNTEKNGAAQDAPGEGIYTFDLEEVDDSADVVLLARLRGVRDQFPLDDEAWLFAGVVRKARVLVVTPGNEVLRDFFDLEETRKFASVRYLAPADLKDEAKYGRPA